MGNHHRMKIFNISIHDLEVNMKSLLTRLAMTRTGELKQATGGGWDAALCTNPLEAAPGGWGAPGSPGRGALSSTRALPGWCGFGRHRPAPSCAGQGLQGAAAWPHTSEQELFMGGRGRGSEGTVPVVQ